MTNFNDVGMVANKKWGDQTDNSSLFLFNGRQLQSWLAMKVIVIKSKLYNFLLWHGLPSNLCGQWFVSDVKMKLVIKFELVQMLQYFTYTSPTAEVRNNNNYSLTSERYLNTMKGLHITKLQPFLI